MFWFLEFLLVAIQMKCLFTFECSNDAVLPYDGNMKVFRASGALTCSWVTVAPENYTVKLIISQKNVDSGGNTNCRNDYIQIRDGGNSSGTLLATLCNSYPGPSHFRSSGTQLWVEYKSTQASNSFEASFKKLLNPSFCPRNVITGGSSGSLRGPYYPNNFPNDMECSWNITGPADSRLVLVFYRICLGICTSVVAQRCGCDSLRVSNVYKSRQLCLETELIPFISLENRISFTMVTDEQYPSKGFIADYESVSLQGACSPMIQMTNMSGWFSSPGFPSNYSGNVQCGWNISIPSGYKIYLTFLEFEVEKCGEACTCDYVEVNRAKSGFSEKKCGTLASGEYVVRNVINDDVVVTFKSDSQGARKGFEAVYTFIPVDAYDSVPYAFCPWTDAASTTKEPEAVTAHVATDNTDDNIQTAVVRTDSDTSKEINSAGRGDWRHLSTLLTICVFTVLCLLSS